MYPARFLVVLGAIALAVALFLCAPLGKLLGLLPAESSLKRIETGGTLLEGQASLPAAGGRVTVRWGFEASSLLRLGFGGIWQASGDGLTADGTFLWRPWGLQVQSERAEVAAARLQRWLASTGARPDQSLSMHDLTLSFGARGRLRAAEGSLAWGPGTVTLRDRAKPVSLPALRGQLSTAEGVVRVTVDGETEPGATLASAELALESRELHVTVLQRAAGMLGVTGGASRSPDTPFFEMRQPLR